MGFTECLSDTLRLAAGRSIIYGWNHQQAQELATHSWVSEKHTTPEMSTQSVSDEEDRYHNGNELPCPTAMAGLTSCKVTSELNLLLCVEFYIFQSLAVKCGRATHNDKYYPPG